MNDVTPDTTVDAVNVAGVQFRRAGRIYDFDSGELDLRIGEDVVVETDRGPSLAKVATLRYVERSRYSDQGLKTILRVATKKDLDEARKLTPESAVDFTKKKVEELELKMTVLQAEIQFGGNKIIIYFSAPGRVDFRELVKELAGGLKARVELKQVGARDEAKLVGGIGICGREYCCSSFLREFVPVSIKMAKNQNLALNPSKVSGGCGRLLCCLTYENDQYTEMRKKIPGKGTRIYVESEGYYGDVIKGDILNQLVLVETDAGQQVNVPVKDMQVVEKSAGREAPTEAEEWGEDIDFDALAAEWDDDGAKGQTSQSDSSGGQAGSSGSSAEKRGGKPRERGGRRGPGKGRGRGDEKAQQDGRGDKPQRSRGGRRGGRRRGGRGKKGPSGGGGPSGDKS